LCKNLLHDCLVITTSRCWKNSTIQPTIGLLLCRENNRVVVGYALRDLKKPIGVAGRETKLVEKLPKALAASLPTVEEIEAELSGKTRRQAKGRKS
jgi:hypothetical protein